jgi:glutamyl-tRNA synthetase
MIIRTRFSPSPTGMIHLGNARAALFSALFSVKNHGAFILRIEDTDQSRSEHQFTELLQDDLQWLGIHWQEGPGVNGPHAPYWQSKRYDIYAHYYQQLEELGRAYPCFCTDQELALNRKIQLSRGQAPRYPGTCRALSKEDIAKRIAEGKTPALRFRVPTQTVIEFVDLVKGTQRFNSDDIGDFIIRRADGNSSFMFCNAIDDSLMEVTHVLRGEDHLANTPRQLMILQTLQMRTAQYGHLSLITGDDGAKLSKREGSFNLHDLREAGYLSLAVLNYLARLGHAYDEQKLLSFAELAAHFHLEKLSRSSARFDLNQLLHWQKETIRTLSTDQMWQWIGDELKNTIPAEKQDLFIKLVQENALLPKDAIQWKTILFGDALEWDEEQLAILHEAGKTFFIAAQKAVEKNGTNLKAILDDLKTELNISGKKLFMPIRIALTAEQHGPELLHIVTLLGVDEMLKRFKKAENLC